VGTTMTFKTVASGGVGPYEYQWWVYDGKQWSIGAAWSPKDTFSWRPNSANSQYAVAAWVRSSTNRDASHTREMENWIPYAVTARRALSVRIESSQPAPQRAGTAIRFTARPSDPDRVYSYKWWLFDGSSWVAVSEWAASPVFVWTPTVPMPGAQMIVRVNDVSDPSEGFGAAVSFPILPK
jgi:hypothetical protein